MKNTQINRNAIKTIAEALGDLNEQVVFVGGAIISQYIDDPAAEDVRPTKDIDITIEVASLAELEDIREELTEKGFTQSYEDDVICRFRYQDIKVDVMATKAVGWAPSNRWFAGGFARRKKEAIDEQTTVRIMPLAYFVASKFEAFNGRGSMDARTSHDFEDIVYVLNYTSTMAAAVKNADERVKAYLLDQFHLILNSPELQEAVRAHLFHEHQEERWSKIISLIKAICQ